METISTNHDKISTMTTLDETNIDSEKNKMKPKKSIKTKLFQRIRFAINWTLPFLNWIGHYSIQKSILHDLFSGIHCGLYQIPHCLALSIICGRPAINSFFSCVVASMLYTIFGSHRRLNYGIFSLVSSIYLGIIIDRSQTLHLVSNSKTLNVEMLTTLITLVIGLYSVIGCIFRIGSFLRFIPYEVLSSFRAGLYLLLAMLQLNSIFGLDLLSRFDLEHQMEQLILPRLIYNKFYSHLRQWSNHNSLFVSIGCITILFAFRLFLHYWNVLFRNKFLRLKIAIRYIPVEFILMSIGMIVVKYSKNFDKYKIILVKDIGHDNNTIFDIKHIHIQIPNFEYYQLIWGECLSASLMLIFFAHSLACDFNQRDTEIDPDLKGTKRIQLEINPSRVHYVRYGWASYTTNRELLSIGIMNILGSFVRCLPIGPNDFISHRQRYIGARSQLSGLISGIVMIIAWFSLHDLFPKTPQCVVASIVTFDCCCRIYNELKQLNKFWAIASIDLVIWILTFSSFIFLNIEFSLYLSVALSLIVYIYRARIFWRKPLCKQKLVQLSDHSSLIVNERIIHDPQTSGSLIFFAIDQLKEIEIFQITDDHLTISNIDLFVCEVFNRLQQSMKSDSVNRFVFDCHTIRRMDWFAVRTIKALIDRLVEIEQSWLAIHSFILEQQEKTFDIDKNNNNNNNNNVNVERRTIVEKTSESRYLVMTFVFPSKIARLIKCAKKPMNYGAFKRSLNVSLRGAFCSILNSLSEQGIPKIQTISSNEDFFLPLSNHEEIVEIKNFENGEIETNSNGSNSSQFEEVVLVTKKNKNPKIRQRLSSYFRSISTPIPVQISSLDDAENNNCQINKEIDQRRNLEKNNNVTTLSFRQTEDEFCSNTSTMNLNSTLQLSQIEKSCQASTFLPLTEDKPVNAKSIENRSGFIPLPPPFPPEPPLKNHIIIQSQARPVWEVRRTSADSDIRQKLETLFSSKTTIL